MLEIFLHDLEFHAYHGLFPAEKKTGNTFRVDIDITCSQPTAVITDLSQTINYAGIYEIVREEMQRPRELLETLAMEIAERLQAEHPLIKKILISIAKLHPPITSFEGEVGIRYSKTFD